MKEKLKKIWNVVKRVLNWVITPVIEQWAFVILACIVLLQQTVGTIVVEDEFDLTPYNWWLVQCYLGLSVLWATIGAHIVHWCGKKWGWGLKTLFYFILLLLFAVHVWLWQVFDLAISPIVATLIAETNAAETSEFISTYGWTIEAKIAYCLAAAMLFSFVLGELLLPWGRQFLSRRVPKIILTALVGIALSSGSYGAVIYVKLLACNTSNEQDVWDRDYDKGYPDLFTATTQAVNTLRIMNNEVKMAVEQAEGVYKTEPRIAESELADSLTVVYVLGESYIKSHAGVYGYRLNTTPYMQKELDNGNLFLFNDVVAQHNATSVVEKNSFSLNCVMEQELWCDAPMWPTIFKRAGYDVFFWDMQKDFMTHKMYTITVNSFLYNDRVAELSYTATNDKTFDYDYQLVQDFTSKVTFTRPCNLVMFHLMGQHVASENRYPHVKPFTHFTADSLSWRTEEYINDERRGLIAVYDNSTLYNDWVMKQIFDLYRDKNAVVIYISDHGEEIYDYRNQKGRHGQTQPTPEYLHCNNDQPLIVWCSDRYKELHPDIVQRIIASANRKFMTDDIGHMILTLGAVTTEYYKADRDLLSPEYKERKRILYKWVNYDEVMEKEK